MEERKINNQVHLARLLVEELRKQGMLEDVICGYSLESVRVCGHCHKLMNEGWIYAGCESFCSDECLMAAHPEEDMEHLRAHASDDDSDSYWTMWES